MRRSILVLLAVLVSYVCGATSEYGANKTAYQSRYFVTTGTVSVRESPSLSASVVMKAEAGDVFYVDDGEQYESEGGLKWIAISGDKGYVPVKGLTVETNPFYERPAEDEVVIFTAPPWLLAVLAAVFILFVAFYFWLARKKQWFKPFAGVKVNGMKKILFYNKEPYLDCCLAALLVLAAFLSTILLFIVVGGISFGGGWLLRALSRVVAWLLIVVGYGGGVAAVCYALWGDVDGCWYKILLALAGIALFWFGGVARGWREPIYDFGDNALGFGGNVFQTFNIFQMSWMIVKVYGKYAFLIMVLPLAALGLCGVAFMLFNYLLILQEKAVMKRFNVANPCPKCGRPSEPAIYRSHGYQLPIPLMPGQFGVYTIEHPVTGEMMPTRFKDGKDYLERECKNCHHIIAARMGTEKHIAFAGVPGSGKTSLMYRLLAQLLDKKVGSEHVAKMTDDNSQEDRQFKKTYQRLEGGRPMTEADFPGQTRRGRRKAFQLLVNNPRQTLPYRLYFNDLAGEAFNADKNQVEDAPFLRNTQLVIFTLDPLTMNLADLSLSSRMATWLSGKGITPADSKGKVRIQEAVDRLLNMIDAYRGGKGVEDIHLIVNLAKSDEGYLGDTPRRSKDLEEFVNHDLGMRYVTSLLANRFKSVTYYAVSASETPSSSRVDSLIEDIFDKVGISFRGYTEEDLRRNRLEAEKIMNERQKEHERTIGGSSLGRSPVGRFAVISFLAVLLAGVISLAWDSHRRSSNYKEAMRQVELLYGENRYDEIISCIDRTIRDKRLGVKDRKRLESFREEAETAWKDRILELVSILDANVTRQKGRLSNLEVNARYGVLDTIRDFKAKLEELKRLDPANSELPRFEMELNRIVKAYSISL